MIFPAHERGSTKTKTGPHASLRRWPSSWRPLWYCSSPYTSLLCCSRSSCRVGVGRRSCSMTLIASAIGVEFLFFFFFFLSCTTPSRKPMLRVKKIFDFLIGFCDILQRPMPARGEERKKQHFHLGKSVRPRARSRAHQRQSVLREGRRQWGGRSAISCRCSRLLAVFRSTRGRRTLVAYPLHASHSLSPPYSKSFLETASALCPVVPVRSMSVTLRSLVGVKSVLVTSAGIAILITGAGRVRCAARTTQ